MRRLWPVGFATAGVVAGHTLGYIVAVPAHEHRGRVLAETGHARWGLVVAVALGLGAAAAAAQLVRGFRAGSSGARVPVPGYASAFARFAALQALLFTALEAGERVLAGVAPSVLAGDRAFWIGLAFQVVVALAASCAIRWLALAAIAIGRSVARRRVRVAATARPAPPFALLFARAPLPAVGSAGVRGPPLR